jgi:hypothetical protein
MDLIKAFEEYVYGPVSEYFRSDSGKDIVEGAAKGFITAQAIQQRNRAQQPRVKEVPYDFARLPVSNIRVGGVPIKINTLRVASIGNSDSLYPMYAEALVQKNTNVYTKDSFKVDAPGTKLKPPPQYRLT